MTINKAFFLRLIDHWPIKILSIAAAVALAQLYKINTLEERFFTVPLEIRIDENYTSVNSSVDNVRIRLRGSEEDVYSVLEEDISAYIDLSEKTKEGEFQTPVLIDKKGSVRNIKKLEINVDPIYARTHIERKLTRSIVVQPKLVEYPLTGYDLVEYFIIPTSVTISGPRSQIEDLQFIPTEDIDLTGRFEDFRIQSRLVHFSEDISFLGGDIIEFSGIITEKIVDRTISEINIVGVDLAENLMINRILPRASIKLQGTQQRIEKLRVQNFQFIIDCSGIIEPGHYSLPVEVDSTEGLTVLKYDPSFVEFDVVLLSEKESGGNP